MTWRPRILGVVSIGVAVLIWLPCMHWFFSPRMGAATTEGEIGSRRHALLKRQLRLWEDPKERAQALAQMRSSNAEWDFMGRTFLVLALANESLREPTSRQRYVAIIDRIVDETLALEKERGMFHFLMPYATSRPFVVSPARSAFIDGEIALMLGARELVMPREKDTGELASRVEALRSHMEQSPVLSAESYPDECWTFCNTMALAAMRLDDAIHGGHRGEELARRWVQRAREALVDPATGLLVSSYTVSGKRLDGPEGSSIWVSTHALMLVDPAFARDQYERARRLLGVQFLGFGWAREWPRSAMGQSDIDSGPIVPILDASAGSSGLAFLGASAFGDEDYLFSLLTTLELVGFPVQGGGLRYAASNQVGDAVLLYALTFGPLWERVNGEAVHAAR